MIEQTEVKHNIQKHILSVLLRQRHVRYRDMRPPRTDTNLYSYHLNQLLKSRLVEKSDDGYTLGSQGLVYVDRLNADKAFVRAQPKIVTMLVVQNSDGGVLVQKRDKQPYIDTWTLPYGKLHLDDESALSGAQREAYEKLGLSHQAMRHAGDCYIRVIRDETLMTTTLAHVFAFERDNIAENESLRWIKPHKLGTLDLAPAVEQIVARTFFRDPFYFEEFTVAW